MAQAVGQAAASSGAQTLREHMPRVQPPQLRSRDSFSACLEVETKMGPNGQDLYSREPLSCLSEESRARVTFPMPRACLLPMSAGNLPCGNAFPLVLILPLCKPGLSSPAEVFDLFSLHYRHQPPGNYSFAPPGSCMLVEWGDAERKAELLDRMGCLDMFAGRAFGRLCLVSSLEHAAPFCSTTLQSLRGNGRSVQ